MQALEGERLLQTAKAGGVSLWELARETGLPYTTLRYRLKSGVELAPIREALKRLLAARQARLDELNNQL